MSFPSVAEKAILAILICLSAAGFWWRFRNVVRIVSTTKPDTDFALGSLFSRTLDFVREVLLQEKVIAQRPLATRVCHWAAIERFRRAVVRRGAAPAELRPSLALEQASAVHNSRHDAGEVFLPDPIGMSVRHPGSSSRKAFAARRSGVSKPSVKRS